MKELKKIINKILAYFPTPIPTGMTKFKSWLDSIVELTGPIADEESLKWVVSNEVMRLSPGRDKVSKMSMVKLLRKYAANQLAAQTVMDLKKAQEDRAKQKLEDTATVQKQSEPKPN